MFGPNLTGRWVKPKREYVPMAIQTYDRELWQDTANKLLGKGFLGLALHPTRPTDTTGGNNLNSTIFKVKVTRSSILLHSKGEITYINNRLLESVNPILQWVLDTIEGGMVIIGLWGAAE